MSLSSTLRAAALLAADVLERQPLGLLRSASDDLRWYGYHGTSRYPTPRPDVLMVGPVAVPRPLHHTLWRVAADIRNAWLSAAMEVSVREAHERVEAREHQREVAS